MLRIVLWTLFLALIAGYWAGKTPTIIPSEIIKNMIMGGLIGCVIGTCFHKAKKIRELRNIHKD